MTEWTDPLQSQESSSSDLPTESQPLLPPPPPTTNPPYIPPANGGQMHLLQQPPTTNPPYISPASGGQMYLPPPPPITNPLYISPPNGGRVYLPQQLPTTNLPSPSSQTLVPPQPGVQWYAPHSASGAQQQPAVQVSLRERYTKEQVELYFDPAPDRGLRIAMLRRQRQQLIQQGTIMIIASLALLILLIVTANMGSILLALLTLGGIIILIYYIRQVFSIKLPPINKMLKWELDKQSEERAEYNRVRPPDEVMFEAWINEIAQDIYDHSPERLHLREREDYRQWQDDLKHGIPTSHEKDPKQYGTDLYLEGHAPIDKKEVSEFRQLYRNTKQSGTIRGTHYAIYEFTSLFITKDYIATYTSDIDLRYPKLDHESFEYGYLPHLSHLLLKKDTINLPLLSTQTDPQQTERIIFKENVLSMQFDSGHKITRNISTLRFGNSSEAVTDIEAIHKTLTHELIDHMKSMPEALKRGNIW